MHIELTQAEAERLAEILAAARDNVLLAKVRTALGWRMCPVCGQTFQGAGRAVYCSATCKQAAYRQRVRSWRRR